MRDMGVGEGTFFSTFLSAISRPALSFTSGAGDPRLWRMDDADVARLLAGRGGRDQRNAYRHGDGADAVMRDAGGGCALVNALLYLFGWGILSLPNVQWIARSATEIGARDDELTILAEIGTKGLYAGNMRRFCRAVARG